MLSPHPDPTLTTDNLMEVVKEVEHHRSLQWALDVLHVPYCKAKEIERLYQDENRRIEAMLDYYVRYSPYASWKEFAEKLHNELAEKVSAKYVKGMDVSHVTLKQVVNGQVLR